MFVASNTGGNDAATCLPGAAQPQPPRESAPQILDISDEVVEEVIDDAFTQHQQYSQKNTVSCLSPSSSKSRYRHTRTRYENIGRQFVSENKVRSRFHMWRHQISESAFSVERMSNSDVAMGFHVLSMGNIDTVAHTFSIELMLFMVWRDDSLKSSVRGWPNLDLDPAQVNIPQYVIFNSKGPPIKTITRLRAHKYKDSSSSLVRLQQKVSVTCHEILELRSFPNDLQELTVSFYFPYLFAKDRSQDPTIHPLAVNGKHPVVWKAGVRFFSEWYMRQPVLRTATSSPSRFGERRPIPELHLTFHLERSPRCLTTLSCASMWIDPEALGNRLEVNFTVVLTVATFKLLVAQLLPRVPYNTLVDKYMAQCMLVLFAIVVLNVISASTARKHGKEAAAEFDSTAFIVWLTAWAICNLVLGF